MTDQVRISCFPASGFVEGDILGSFIAVASEQAVVGDANGFGKALNEAMSAYVAAHPKEMKAIEAKREAVAA
jgi:hypothetical protein